MEISDEFFKFIRTFIYERAGIALSEDKRALVIGRLTKRLRRLELGSFEEYWSYLLDPTNDSEIQKLIDVLTTNETRFFREPKHFDTLARVASEFPKDRELNLWCAASSTGEEPYSLAMTLSHVLQNRWKMVATDINTKVLDQARTSLYPMQAIERIPYEYRHKFCMKGVRSQEGNFIISKRLRENVLFKQLNLIESFPNDLGEFHVVFIRNVLIYFDRETIGLVIKKIMSKMAPGGLLFIGHSENIRHIDSRLEAVEPTVYRVHHARR